MTSTKKAIEAIRLKEGGERLYIFVVANKPFDYRSFPRVRYLTTEEFPFYENDQILTKNSILGQIYPWRVLGHICWSRVFTLFKKVRFWLAYKYWFSGLEYQPVVAERIWDKRISIDGQIEVNSEWSDTYYLNPSQKYLKARVNQWIKSRLRMIDDGFGRNDAANLQNWQRQCRQDGYEITYLASLDT